MTENSQDWVLRPKPTSVAAMVDRAPPLGQSPQPAPGSASRLQAWRGPAVAGGALVVLVLAVLARVLRRRR